MNSASPGGRAGKNAIDEFNNTLNIQRVKVFCRFIFIQFLNDLLLNLFPSALNDFEVDLNYLL